MRSRQQNGRKARPGSAPAPAQSAAWKNRGFRLAALVLAPLLCFAVVEGVLRLGGFGYRASFLKPLSFDGQRLLAQNNQFGWRFFGPQMARTPYPIAIPPSKKTIRIFVFGESAAFGDPQPQFGLPRMLKVLLSSRYPGVRFEVVNAAMTGINSHVILPIARDCARADGDIWVLYMGNNEVVGPFGAGTVFGPRAPPRMLVQGRVAFLATRSGQLLDTLARRLRPSPLAESEWGGMKMFLDRPVRASDPALETVYSHFARNLESILQVAERHGVGLVLSTVAVNLRDCGPFASAHRPGLLASDKAKWDELYANGCKLLALGDPASAADRFEQAAAIDSEMAELRFRQGECASKLGRDSDAQRHFEAARDSDTLRFRCDGRLNQITRQAAAGREQQGVRLVDAERVFAQHSSNGLPGQELFCDHVHFTFEGTYLLARAIAEQVEPLLPDRVRAQMAPDRGWLSGEGCAQRLAWTDWSRAEFFQAVWMAQSGPPFTAQLHHSARMGHLKGLLQNLQPARLSDGLQRARAACQAALAESPGDAELHAQLARLQQEMGDLAGAEASARNALAFLPASAENWAQLGLILVARQQYPAAAECFRGAINLDPQDVSSMHNLAQALVRMGNNEEAEREYRRAVAVKPRFGPGWLGLGQLLEESGRTAAAEDCFQRALANPVRRPAELLWLARFCQSRGWREAAITNYTEAIKLQPTDPKPYFELAQTLAALGRHAEAAARYAELVEVAPQMAEGHFLYAVAAGRLGRAQEAAQHFREAARLKPDLVEARINLGIALMNQGHAKEALAEFESVLERDPAHSLARRHAETLRLRNGRVSGAAKASVTD